jgi:D-glycero-alpha-D-manno-heptose-7-phosphate kinase
LLLKYSKIESAATQDDVSHPLIRECLKATGVWKGIEISSMADIPTGTGLGSSGSFTVGLLKALRMHGHQGHGNIEIAAEACEIEMDRLGEPVGKQDQYIAAAGGITAFTFHADESVDVEPLALKPMTRSRLEENLLLFYTGVRRSASEVLAEERSTTAATSSRLDESLDKTRALGYETQAALLDDDLDRFGALLSEQWEQKYSRQPNETHDRINSWIQAGIEAGGAGGKLVGAGGGGFLLFYADRKAELRQAMTELGLTEVRFRIDYEGPAVIVAH